MTNDPNGSDNPYDVLGLTPHATRAEISRAYRTHARRLHPDTRRADDNPPPDTDADGDLRRVLAAYALLSNPTRRAAYDTLQHPSRPITIRPATTARPRGGEPAEPVDPPPIVAGPVRWQSNLRPTVTESRPRR